MRKLHFLICLVISTSELFAQTFINYTKASSLLCNDTVLSVAFDGQGNRWFGTAKGISEFDGTNWKTYDTTDGLAGNMVTCMTTDASGNKWFGTDDGISKFTDTAWTNYMSSGYYTCIKTDSENSVWLTSWPLPDTNWPMSGTVISKFDGVTWKEYDHSDEPYYSIAIDSMDNKWFSTPGIIYKYDGVSWVTYYFGLGETMDLAFDRNGILWTSDARKFDGDNFVSILDDGMLGDFYFQGTSLAIDSKNNKWFGTLNNGVWKYNDSTWTNYTLKDGLINDQVNSIEIDAEDNIWIGTWGGVSELVQNEVTQAKEEPVNPGIVLYPMPVSDKLKVSLSNPVGTSRIEIFSIDGIKLCSFPVDDDLIEFDMSNYPSGAYILMIKTLNKGIVTRRIIKTTH